MKIVLDTLDFNTVVQKIVDSVLLELGYLELGYSIVVLALKDEEKEILERISISQTDKAKKALQITPVPFKDIKIPLDCVDNYCIRALNENKPLIVNDWKDLLLPSYTTEDAQHVQKILDIKSSIVYPVNYQGKTVGVLIFSMQKNESEMSEEERDLISSFTDVVGLAVQNARLYSALESSSQKLKQLNSKLKALDKQKDEFINMAAHELRAPMTAIKGYVSMILDGDAGEITEQTRGYLTDVTSVNDRLVRLVNNMLNVSRIEEGRLIYKTEVTSLTEVARTVFTSFKFEAERKGLEFKLDVENGVKDSVEVDIDRVNEIIGNFVSNAVKYTDHGSICISITNPNDSTVRLGVKDTGPGISKAEQHKLFQKFYRVESTAGKTIGTGLGLYIAKLLVNKFGGEMGLISDSGKGSEFWFRLPITDKKISGDQNENSEIDKKEDKTNT